MCQGNSATPNYRDDCDTHAYRPPAVHDTPGPSAVCRMGRTGPTAAANSSAAVLRSPQDLPHRRAAQVPSAQPGALSSVRGASCAERRGAARSRRRILPRAARALYPRPAALPYRPHGRRRARREGEVWRQRCQRCYRLPTARRMRRAGASPRTAGQAWGARPRRTAGSSPPGALQCRATPGRCAGGRPKGDTGARHEQGSQKTLGRVLGRAGPNQALEPTPSSLRYAAASSRA
jgi:hypothetical protein